MCSVCVPSDGCADCSLCLVQEVGQTQGMYVCTLTLRLKELWHLSACIGIQCLYIKTTSHVGTAG